MYVCVCLRRFIVFVMYDIYCLWFACLVCCSSVVLTCLERRGVDSLLFSLFDIVDDLCISLRYDVIIVFSLGVIIDVWLIIDAYVSIVVNTLFGLCLFCFGLFVLSALCIAVVIVYACCSVVICYLLVCRAHSFWALYASLCLLSMIYVVRCAIVICLFVVLTCLERHGVDSFLFSLFDIIDDLWISLRYDVMIICHWCLVDYWCLCYYWC